MTIQISEGRQSGRKHQAHPEVHMHRPHLPFGWFPSSRDLLLNTKDSTNEGLKTDKKLGSSVRSFQKNLHPTSQTPRERYATNYVYKSTTPVFLDLMPELQAMEEEDRYIGLHRI